MHLVQFVGVLGRDVDDRSRSRIVNQGLDLRLNYEQWTTDRWDGWLAVEVMEVVELVAVYGGVMRNAGKNFALSPLHRLSERWIV